MYEAGSIELRRAISSDMPLCAGILNRWIDETTWMPRVHDHADVVRHYCETVFAEREVTVADIDGAVAGFVAISQDQYVTALYVDGPNRRHGLGARLLAQAKEACPAGLHLWTFVANQDARQFYDRHAFLEVRRTQGDNEEGLPDILLAWQPENGA